MQARAEFEQIWQSVIELRIDQDLVVGRGAYGGWDERGATTRSLLEALERNGSGRLWRIDLPPLLERSLSNQTAAAVPEGWRSRWRYLEGSSRRRLPRLLGGLGEIETERQM